MNDETRLADFEARIEAGETIEPKDWMPEQYRRQLIRMISQHAHSEIVGMLPEGNWLTRAPSLRRKMGLLAKVQDEAGHGLYLYSAAETLGAERLMMIGQLLDQKAKYSSIFNYPKLTWADVGVIGWFVDGAAIVNQTMLARCSYGPYARANLRICREESFHKKQGFEIVSVLSQGTNEQREMAQNAVNRWWLPTLMMFGPGDQDSPNSRELMKWRVKLKSNDELRQRFIDLTIPQARALNLTLPDESLRFNDETGHWEHGPLDWKEFYDVINGRGQCSYERIKARRDAHEKGKWVREAAEAYARKKQSKQESFD